MNVWTLLGHTAWAVSVLIFVWILVDALKVGRDYDDDFLLSSAEGDE